MKKTTIFLTFPALTVLSASAQTLTFDPTMVITLADSDTCGFVDGTGPAAWFCRTSGVSVDASGNIFVADVFNNRIRKITAAGVVTTLAGSDTAGFADGIGAAAWFNNPENVSVDASGNVFVADLYNNRYWRCK